MEPLSTSLLTLLAFMIAHLPAANDGAITADCTLPGTTYAMRCPDGNEYTVLAEALSIVADYFGEYTATCSGIQWDNQADVCTSQGVRKYVGERCNGRRCDIFVDYDDTNPTEVTAIYRVSYTCCSGSGTFPALPPTPESYLTLEAPSLVQFQPPGSPVSVVLLLWELEDNVTMDGCTLSFGDGEEEQCFFLTGDPAYTVSHVYTTPGCYQLRAQVTQLAMEAQQETCVHRVLEGVDVSVGLTLEIRQEIGVLTDAQHWVFFTDQRLLFSAILSGDRAGLEYHWDIGGVASVSHLSTITQVFNQKGVYSVRLAVSNAESSTAETTGVFTILVAGSAPCSPARVAIDISDTNASHPLVFPRHVPLSFSGHTHLDPCPYPYRMDLHWRLIRRGSGGEEEGAEVAESPVGLPSSVVSDQQALALPRGLLGYGLYALELGAVVQLSGFGFVIGQSTSDRTWLRIKSSQPVAVIQGGSARLVGYSSSFSLDGSGSYNPDDLEDPTRGLQYEWRCVQGAGDFYAWTADGACFEDGSRLPSNGSSVQLRANTLVPDLIYEFTLTVSIPGQGNTSASQRVSVVAEDPPILSIGCLQNCEEKLSIADRLVLTVTTSKKPVSFQWDVLSSDGRPQDDFDWDGQTTTGRSRAFLVFVGGAFGGGGGDDGARSVRITGYQADGPPGFAVYTFVPNSPPHLGTCSLVPATGYALQTRFVVACADFWDEDGALMYTVRVPPLNEARNQASLQYLDPVLYSGASATTPSVYLPLGEEVRGHEVTIAVDVADIHGAAVQFTMTAVVLPPETLNVEDDKDTSVVLLNLTSGTDSELQRLITNGEMQTAVQMIGAVGSILDNHDASGQGGDHAEESESKAIRQEIRSSTVNTIASMPVETVVSLQQSSYALVAITQEKTEITQETQLTAASTLVRMGAFLKEVSVERTDCENCQRSIDDAALNLVTGLSNVLDAAVASVEDQREVTTFVPSPAPTNDTSDEEETQDGDTPLTNEVTEKSKVVAQAAFAAIADVQDALIVNKVPGEAPTVIRSPALTLRSHRVAPDSLGVEPIGTTAAKSSTIILPDSALIGGFLPANYTDAIDTQVVQFATDPFTWNEGDETITSEVVGLQLKTVNRQEIKVTQLPQDVQIFIPKRTVTLANDTNVTLSDHHTIVISFNVTDVNATVSVLTLPDEADQALACCLRFGGSDSPDNASAAADCHANASLPGAGFERRAPVNEDEDDTSLRQRFTWMITQQFGQGEGVYQVLCWAQGPSGAVGSSAQESQAENRTLLLSVYSSQCLFWNDADSRWDHKGCKVGPLSTPEVTQCLCDHLTFFGSSFLVMPNKIDFLADSRLFLTFVDNPVVVTAVGAILILYTIAAVWARRRDRVDVLKARVMTLEDNDPFASHRYDVTVVTGMRRGAGTTATATLTVLGRAGTSGPHVLLDRQRSVLQRGGADSFLVTTRESLGEVTAVRIWHDNGGASPEWYASRITVHDLETDQWWFILCDAWLGVGMGEGLIDRTFPTATAVQLRDFQHLFSSRTVRDMQDGHLWFSIFHRPARSSFTRLQRVSCCLALLMSVMLTSIMFYGVPEDPGDQVMDFGSFRITFTEIVIGIESSILAFPINLLLVSIFRLARPAGGGTPRPANVPGVPGSESSAGSQGSPSGRPVEDVRLSFPETLTDQCGSSTDTTFYSTVDVLRSSSDNETIDHFSDATGEDSSKEFNKVTGEGKGDVTGVGTCEGITGGSTVGIGIEPVEGTDVGTSKGSSKLISKGFNKGKGERTSDGFSVGTSGGTGDGFSEGTSKGTGDEFSEGTSKGTGDEFSEGTSRGTHEGFSEGTSEGSLRDSATSIKRLPCKSAQNTYKAFLFSCLDQIIDDLDLMSPDRFTSPEEYLLAKREARGLVLTAMTIRTPSSTPSVSCQSVSTTSRESSACSCSCRLLPNGLPHWFVYIGWALVFCTTLVSSYFTMLYGLKYGRKRSVDWLMSLLVSLVQSIFLIQPLKVLLVAAFVALVLKQWDPDDDGSDDIEEQHIDDAQAVYRKLQHTWKGALYQPPAATVVGTARRHKDMERRMYSLLRQILGYFLFIWLVLVISYSQRDRFSYHLTQHTKDVFFSGDEYDSISDVDSFFEWAGSTMLPGLYEGDAVANTTSFLVGGVRFRQLRVRQDLCDIPPITGVSINCSLPYARDTEDTVSYTPFWDAPLANKTRSGPASPWEFQADVASGLWGRVSSYGGGGYVATLGPNETASAQRLAELRADGWLDHRTRALVVEWAVYNANTNLFAAVRFLLESPATGGLVRGPTVRTVRLHRGAANLQVFVLCVEVSFALSTLLYGLLEVRRWRAEGRAYWRSAWNWLETAIVLACWAVIAVYVHRHVLANRLLVDFRHRRAAFVDLRAPADAAEALAQLLGLLLVLCTVKFLYLLRLNPRTYLLTAVLGLAAGDVAGFAGLICLILCAFALLFQLVFGGHVATYSTVARAFGSLFALFMGDYDYEELYAVAGSMALLLVVTFQALASFILLNVLISVLSNSMSLVRRLHEPSEDGQVGLLLLYKILSWLGIRHKHFV